MSTYSISICVYIYILVTYLQFCKYITHNDQAQKDKSYKRSKYSGIENQPKSPSFITIFTYLLFGNDLSTKRKDVD